MHFYTYKCTSLCPAMYLGSHLNEDERMKRLPASANIFLVIMASLNSSYMVGLRNILLFWV